MEANQKISNMENIEALPRKSGELVFHDEWEKRVFAMVVTLYEQGYFEWEEFKTMLIKQIKIDAETFEEPNLKGPSYYEYWIDNLELILDKAIDTKKFF